MKIINDGYMVMCDYCCQKYVFMETTHIRHENGTERNICHGCVIKAMDKVFGIPEHKTEDMEKMFVIE
jgi:hypothetical protein